MGSDSSLADEVKDLLVARVALFLMRAVAPTALEAALALPVMKAVNLSIARYKPKHNTSCKIHLFAPLEKD